MSWKVLFIKLLLVHYTKSQEAGMQTANCHDDVPLKCPGVDLDHMDFLSVAWFKSYNTMKYGIIRKHKAKKDTRHYNFTRSPKPEFGENYSLMLHRVTPNDSGTYECDISANVGGRNQNLKVVLIVQECVTKTDATPRADVLNLTRALCSNQVEDLPVMWSIIGYLAVGLAKIVVSLICIWVIRAWCTRSSRRRQKRW